MDVDDQEDATAALAAMRAEWVGSAYTQELLRKCAKRRQQRLEELLGLCAKSEDADVRAALALLTAEAAIEDMLRRGTIR